MKVVYVLAAVLMTFASLSEAKNHPGGHDHDEEWGTWALASTACDNKKSCGNFRERYTRICVPKKGPGCTGNKVKFEACKDLPPCASWGAWKPKGKCSAKCGDGQQVYKRKCIKIKNGPKYKCPGPNTKKEPCNRGDCSTWGEWQDWECSASCGAGQMTQTRDCIKGIGKCVGDYEQTAACNNGACASWGEWQDGECTGTCFEPGTITSTRECTGLGDCDGEGKMTTECRVQCGEFKGTYIEDGNGRVLSMVRQKNREGYYERFLVVVPKVAGATNQLWDVSELKNGNYGYIYSKVDGLVADIYYAERKPGTRTKVHGKKYHPHANHQLWRHEDGRIATKLTSNLVLQSGWQRTNNVVMNNAGDGANQQWSFNDYYAPVMFKGSFIEDGNGRVLSMARQKNREGYYERFLVVVPKVAGVTNQLWDVSELKNGNYGYIFSKVDGLVADIYYAERKPGTRTKVHRKKYHPHANHQLWRHEDGRIATKLTSNLVLQSGWQRTNNVVMNNAGDGANQQWSFNDYYAPACWKVRHGVNAVSGLIIGGPKTESRPATFYFGDFGADQFACAKACSQERDCVAWALHKPSHKQPWTGGCYGRSSKNNVRKPNYFHVVSGFLSTNC